MTQPTPQITKRQAIALSMSGFWKTMGAEERARFQFWAVRCCMPFSVFQQAVMDTLSRPVYTHELRDFEGILAEMNGERPVPTPDEIIAIITVGDDD